MSPQTEFKKIPHLSIERVLVVSGQWLAALSPVLLVLIAGLLLFRSAVVTSIASTPHPELVYAILGTFAVGVLLTSITLMRYTFEGNVMTRWARAHDLARRRLLSKTKHTSYLFPVYQILSGDRALSVTARQATLEQEMNAINERLTDRLTLPHYLSGALVGLGLVGTFVGLLGTLEDLGKLFATLVNTSDSGLNPTEVFADMVRRLQDPMRGMGTAFVASLYGLLGSLVLGLNILAIGKVGHALSTQMHALVRNSDATSHAHAIPTLTDPPQGHAHAESAQQSWHDLATSIQSQQAQNSHDTQLLRREMLTVIDASKRVTQAIYEGIRADERYRTSVPRTSYWQDAWIKVQAYLQRSDTDQALAELSRNVRIQSQTLVDISMALHRIDDHLRAHLVSQIAQPPADFYKNK